MANTQTQRPILIRRPEVLRRCAISNSTLHRRINTGTFPAPVPLGPGAVAWVESEIDAWIESRIEARHASQALAK